jgi:hypothetical protein
MRPIGFSTGALALADFRKALAMLSGCSSVSVIELSALRESELAPLVRSLDVLDLRQFSYVAVHAPSVMGADNEKRAVELLDSVALRDWPIVVHPDAIHDWGLWRHFGSLLCVENMDKRKAIGRSHVELAACFDRLPEASLCADLGHARQVDPTMTGAHFILRDFADRLRQAHLSEVSTDSRHDRISYTCSLGFREVAALVPDHVPIVLETPVASAEIELEIRRARAALDVPSHADSNPRNAGSAISPAA